MILTTLKLNEFKDKLLDEIEKEAISIARRVTVELSQSNGNDFYKTNINKSDNDKLGFTYVAHRIISDVLLNKPNPRYRLSISFNNAGIYRKWVFVLPIGQKPLETLLQAIKSYIVEYYTSKAEERKIKEPLIDKGFCI